MSVRAAVRILKEQGGTATLAEMNAKAYVPTIRLKNLIRQGYVERTGKGVYALTPAGHQLAGGVP